MKLVTLGNCCTVVRGSSPRPKGDPRFYGPGVPRLMVADLTRDGKSVQARIDSLTQEGAKKSRPMRAGDLVIAVSGNPGLPAIISHDLCIHDGFVGLRNLSSDLSVDYVYWFLKAFHARVNATAVGAIFKNLTTDQIKDLQIPLPTLAEQKRIAAILDAADALRANRRESLAQLDTLLQSTFLDLFGDLVTNPKGWEVEMLGKICDVRDGTHDSPKYQDEGYPLLTSKNFKEGRIDFEGANLISAEDFLQINKRSKVDVGDLVMPMIGTIGNPVLVEDEPNFAIKNVALIKFGKTTSNNKFIRALLCSHYFDHITSKANRGGTQKFVALKDLRCMPIPLPPTDLQHRFATIVESVEQQKARLREHLTELDTLFASLQHRAFNGEL